VADLRAAHGPAQQRSAEPEHTPRSKIHPEHQTAAITCVGDTMPEKSAFSRRDSPTVAHPDGGSNRTNEITIGSPRTNRAAYRVPTPTGPAVTFEISSSAGFHDGSCPRSVQ
jgi:hypothetical protein